MAAMATSLVTNRKNRTINTYTEDNGSQVSNYLGKKELQIWDGGQLEELALDWNWRYQCELIFNTV